MNTRMCVKILTYAYASRHTCSMHAAGSNAHELKVDMAAEKYVFDTFYIYICIHIHIHMHARYPQQKKYVLAP